MTPTSASELALKTPCAPRIHPNPHSTRAKTRHASTYGQHEHALFTGPLLWNTFTPESWTSAVSPFQFQSAFNMPVSDFVTPTKNVCITDAILGILLPQKVAKTVQFIELAVQNMLRPEIVYRHRVCERPIMSETTCSNCSLGDGGKLHKDMVYVPIEGMKAFTILHPCVEVEITVETDVSSVSLSCIEGAMIHYLVTSIEERFKAIEKLSNVSKATRPDNKDNVDNCMRLPGSVSVGKEKTCSSCWMCDAKSHAVEYVTHRTECRARGPLLIVHHWNENVSEYLKQLPHPAPHLCCDALRRILDDERCKKLARDAPNPTI